MVAYLCPKIFLKALDFSGGILSNLMVGILPIAVLIRERKLNFQYFALLLIFLWIFILELIRLAH
jgi:hypothetical protein